MTGAGRLALGTSALFAIAVLGCERPNAEEGRAEHQPVAIADQEDEVCGMLVREQSAPRSQIVHRDGSRVFFCSLGDMLVHLGAPSPRGRAEALFVEVMAPHEDPMQTHAGPHEWVEAHDAVYVVGIERRSIMGEPVLAYASEAHAKLAMQGRDGARMLDLPALESWWMTRQAAD
jgi:nitrous oxide reductase accessory protein NosL